MKIAAYVRISHYSQNEASQRAAIERWLSGHGITDARWFVDTATGDNLDRPAFDQLQQAVFMGEIDTIVVFKIDRISRSLRDGIATLCDWLDKGVRLVAVSQGHDFSGPTGKLIASVLFSVAEMEQSTRRERQAEGIAVAREKGVYKGRKPGSTVAKPARARQLRRQGLKDAEIAAALGVTRRTVLRYVNGQ
jgi:DNA invertase Pin-like site-specific DNA recombinase